MQWAIPQTCNKGSTFFLWCRSQCRKEMLTNEEVYIEESFKMLMMKCNSVWVFKFNEKWKDLWLWLSAEDGKMFCSYCKEFNKTSRNKFISGCKLVHIKGVHSQETSNAHKNCHSAFVNNKKLNDVEVRCWWRQVKNSLQTGSPYGLFRDLLSNS